MTLVDLEMVENYHSTGDNIISLLFSSPPLTLPPPSPAPLPLLVIDLWLHREVAPRLDTPSFFLSPSFSSVYIFLGQ